MRLFVIPLFLLGIEVISGSVFRICRPILLLAVADLPARALITCLKQFNGRNACLYCCQEGTSVSGQICWPFEEIRVARTKKSLMEDAKKALRQTLQYVLSALESLSV